MSKSLGNISRVSDLLASGAEPRALRLALISAHYRTNLNYNDDSLTAAASAIARIDAFVAALSVRSAITTGDADADHRAATLAEASWNRFAAAMDDDLAVPEALAALFNDPDLRRRMGESARLRARSEFDWRVVIKAYQALWAELERRRLAAPAQGPASAGENPWALDPFIQFQAYPTQILGHDDTVILARPLTDAEIVEIISRDEVMTVPSRLPSVEETLGLLAALPAQAPVRVGDLLETFPPERRALLERALVWLAKFGLVRLSGTSPAA
jgi:hypothetical protein